MGRRRLGVGVAAAALLAAAIALPATASAAPPAAPAASAWAPAATAAVHPGVLTVTQGGGICTSNFVFRAGDTVYLGQAAHCAATGDVAETNGCTATALPLGTPVEIRGSGGYTAIGRLAYSSWSTMQARAEADPPTCAYNDFSLVELPADAVTLTNPSVPFFGGPQGLDTDGLAPRDVVYTYGNSPWRQDIALLRPKVGASTGTIGGGWAHDVYTVTPGVPGDSGSGFLNAAGAAIGLLSTLNLAPLPLSNTITDLAQALAYADVHAGLGQITLVDGTEPFNPLPLGVPAADLVPPVLPS